MFKFIKNLVPNLKRIPDIIAKSIITRSPVIGKVVDAADPKDKDVIYRKAYAAVKTISNAGSSVIGGGAAGAAYIMAPAWVAEEVSKQVRTKFDAMSGILKNVPGYESACNIAAERIGLEAGAALAEKLPIFSMQFPAALSLGSGIGRAPSSMLFGSFEALCRASESIKLDQLIQQDDNQGLAITSDEDEDKFVKLDISSVEDNELEEDLVEITTTNSSFKI